jgi:5'-methylthioadenosine phosphorylase
MSNSATVSIGLIGGSGLYEMADLTERAQHEMDTPYGRPSDPIVTGKLAGVPVAFPHAPR